jgi:hypothetical protein
MTEEEVLILADSKNIIELVFCKDGEEISGHRVAGAARLASARRR